MNTRFAQKDARASQRLNCTDVLKLSSSEWKFKKMVRNGNFSSFVGLDRSIALLYSSKELKLAA